MINPFFELLTYFDIIESIHYVELFINEEESIIVYVVTHACKIEINFKKRIKIK